MAAKRYYVIGFWIRSHKDSSGEFVDDLSYEEATALRDKWRNDNIHKCVTMAPDKVSVFGAD